MKPATGPPLIPPHFHVDASSAPVAAAPTTTVVWRALSSRSYHSLAWRLQQSLAPLRRARRLERAPRGWPARSPLALPRPYKTFLDIFVAAATMLPLVSQYFSASLGGTAEPACTTPRQVLQTPCCVVCASGLTLRAAGASTGRQRVHYGSFTKATHGVYLFQTFGTWSIAPHSNRSSYTLHIVHTHR